MTMRMTRETADCDGAGWGAAGQGIRPTVRSVLGAALLAALALPGAVVPAWADDLPGVTATEIKIGNTNAYSGPASSYGAIAKTETAFFKMVNDQGGVAGHKINFISYERRLQPSEDR
jgi:branched-chain amino acid transport system substrate-binding protein